MVLIIMTVAVVSMLGEGLSLAIHGMAVQREAFLDKYDVLTRISADRSAAAVVFSDARLAKENVAALLGDEDVVDACIFDAQGRVLAQELRDGGDCPPYRLDSSSNIDMGYLNVHQPIVLDNEVIGAVYLRAQLTKLSNAVWRVIVVTAIIFVLGAIIALYLASRLQDIVSGPIQRLAALAQYVSDSRDYSVKAKAQSDDEVGALVASFNVMLDTIHRQHNDLEASRAQLEELVAVRTHDLQQANEDLKSFSYSVSHDLRAPLRTINGFSAILVEDFGEQLDGEASRYLQRIQSASAHMDVLIESLLTLSNLSHKEMVVSESEDNMTRLAKECVRRLQEADPNHPVEVVIEGGMSARGDQSLLAILYTNLIGNAWKYSSRMNRPRIEVGAVMAGTRRVFFVRDNGVGFDVQYSQKLFCPFERLHGKDEFDGVGIGLATVKRIIDRHHGEVWAESVPNEGATFFFTLG